MAKADPSQDPYRLTYAADSIMQALDRVEGSSAKLGPSDLDMKMDVDDMEEAAKFLARMGMIDKVRKL